VVLGRRALGEHDRLVEFFTRDFGRLRGVARGARRSRARSGSALEPFTLGALLFFESGRSDLVRVDHFDILRPFGRLRDDLDRIGRGGQVLECVSRLSAERDAHPALFRLLVRGLGALDGPAPPDRAFLCFALRAVDVLGHRPRLDRCVGCGRGLPVPAPRLDMTAGGLACGPCAGAGAVDLSPGALGALRGLRGCRWEAALALPLRPGLERELTGIMEAALAALMGQPSRAARFVAQARRGLSRVAEPVPEGGGRGAARGLAWRPERPGGP
jgi:DNA repair protein RecO (recombination protein O)